MSLETKLTASQVHAHHPRLCDLRPHSLGQVPSGLLSVAKRLATGRSRGPQSIYAIKPSLPEVESPVLKLPERMQLKPEQLVHVFGYPRNFLDKYFLGKVLGYGSFGIVRECMEKESGKLYAVKLIKKLPKGAQPPTPRSLLKIRSEVEIMQQLGNSLDAVNMKEVFEDETTIQLVMQLCDGGALLERINARTEPYSEAFIAGLVRSILRFVSQCHAKGFIYRDVKPDNFLFLNKEADSPLKATDLGLAVRYWPNEPKLTSKSGTPAYMAPELVLGSYDEKCDLWSVGMLTYQLLTGRYPYWEKVDGMSLNAVFKSILNEEINWEAKELKVLSDSAVDFLKQLLHPIPPLRPSAAKALEHPWLQQESDTSDLPLKGTVVQRLQRFSTFGLLKQMVLKMVFDMIREEREEAQANNLEDALDSPEREAFIAAVKELFKDIDTDNNGAIAMAELQDGLRRLGYALNESEVVQLGRRPDLNISGDIDLHELMTALIDWNVVQGNKEWKSYLNRAFDKLDEDKSGYIELDELLRQLEQMKVESARNIDDMMKEAKIMLREADSNGDGVISRQEFMHLLQANHAQDALSLYDTRLHTGRKKS